MMIHISSWAYTVKRVDEVVRHPHLVTQDQNTQVSNKFFDIPVENFTINIELFRHFSQCRTSSTEQESVKSRKFYYKYRTFPTFSQCRTSSTEQESVKSSMRGANL